MDNPTRYGQNLVNSLEEILKEIFTHHPPYGVFQEDLEYFGWMIKRYKESPRGEKQTHMENQIVARLIRRAKQGYDIRFISRYFQTFKSLKNMLICENRSLKK